MKAITMESRNNPPIKREGGKVVGMGNTIFTIFPYKLGGQWMFDYPEKGIHQEAFVAGADCMLDLVCKGAERCTAIFSAKQFPDHDLTLTLKQSYPEGAADYYCEELKHDLWLCSCLASFLSPQPDKIFLKIKL